MRIALAVICDGYEINEGGWGFNLIGACPEVWALDAIPGETQIPFAMVLALESFEQPTRIRSTLEIVRVEDDVKVSFGEPAAQAVHISPALVPGAPRHLLVGNVLNAKFDRVGVHEVRLTIGEGEDEISVRVPFGTRLRSDDERAQT